WFRRDRPELPTPTPGPSAPRGPALDDVLDLLVDDRLHVSTVESVASALDRRKTAWDLNPDQPDPYSPEVLYWHQDFRTLLAIRFVSSLAEDYGVQTEIKQVLSMPLGASEITLEEATSLYAGLVSGTAWEFAAEGADGQKLQTATSMIQEIRNVDGRVLYRAEPRTTRVVDPTIGALTADILRNVVLHGTGRRAAAVQYLGHPVPVGGKTGTTNDFRNAAFVGYVPVANPLGYAVQDGYSIGVYVGYDDNRSMASGRIKLAGASGALPAWVGTAQGLAAAGMLGDTPTVQVEADAPWPLVVDPRLARVSVDEKVGIVIPEGTASVLVASGDARPEIGVPRVMRPSRVAPPTEDALQLAPLDGLPPPTPTDEVVEEPAPGGGEEPPSIDPPSIDPP
ncbi:MAG: hypothetical protein ABMA64_05045, partial [Myxococcota bacterium]